MVKRPKAAPPTITKVIVSARKAYKRRSGGAASRAPRDVMSRGSNGQARRPWAIEIQAVRCTLFDQSVLSSNRRQAREDLEEPIGEGGQIARHHGDSQDRKSTRLNSSHLCAYRMPLSA